MILVQPRRDQKGLFERVSKYPDAATRARQLNGVRYHCDQCSESLKRINIEEGSTRITGGKTVVRKGKTGSN